MDDAVILHFILKAKNVKWLLDEDEVLNKKILEQPENNELKSKKKKLEQLLEKEFNYLKNDTTKILRIINVKEDELWNYLKI